MNQAVRDTGSGKPLRRLPRPRLLTAALGIAGVAVIVAGFFLQSSTPFVDPSPPEGYGTAVGPVQEPPSTPPGQDPSEEGDTDAPPVETPTTTQVPEPTTPLPTVPVSSGHPEDLPAQQPVEPVRLVIPALGIDAPIRPVGVRNGEMEVPPTADLVAWYRFGPTPGAEGSAVLAAHVSWGGELGVFYRLRDLPPGAMIEVVFADGSARRFRSVALDAYDKSDLPVQQIFAREGDPVLTLVTCGGAFNESLRHFEQNIVAYAVPIEGPEGPAPGVGSPS